jgi:hypothetical protein
VAFKYRKGILATGSYVAWQMMRDRPRLSVDSSPIF